MTSAITSLPKDIIIADSVLGGFRLYPTTYYTISMPYDDLPRISIEGIVGDKFLSAESKQARLHEFSMLDLMDEVGRRIKMGENKKESVKRSVLS